MSNILEISQPNRLLVDSTSTTKVLFVSKTDSTASGLQSFNGRTVVNVVPTASDYTLDMVDETVTNKLFTATEKTKLSGIETSADVTDSSNVVSSIDSATITAVTVATGDKILLKDVSDSDNLKTSTAQEIANLAPSGIDVGIMDYNDTSTASTPLTIVGGDPAVVVPNDGLGAQTTKAYAPDGVTDIFDVSTNSFDFSELEFGDHVSIRISAMLTTASPNTEIHLDLHLGTGAGSYDIPFISGANYKSAGQHALARFDFVYIIDSNTQDNLGQFKISADKNCSLVWNGMACQIFKRNLP